MRPTLFRWWRSALVAGLPLVAPCIVLAAPAAGEINAAQLVLDELRDHGYVSPRLGLQRLKSVATPGPDAPADLRWRYQAALVTVALRAKDEATATQARRALEQAVDKEGCAPCRTVLLLIEAAAAQNASELPKLRELADRITAMPEPADPQLRVARLMTLGLAWMTLGEMDVAVATSLKAVDLSQQLGRAADHVMALNTLALANADRGDAQRGLALLDEEYQRAREIGFHYQMVVARSNEGYVRAEMKQNEERRAPLYDSLALARQVPGLETLQWLALNNIANFHNDRHEYRQGLRFAEDARTLALQLKDRIDYAFSIVNKGVALTHLGDTEEGLRLVREAVSIAEKAQLKSETAILLEQLVDAAETGGRPQEALQALRRATALRQEMMQTKRDKDVLALQERYSAERKSREIERLQLENARRHAELEATASKQRLWAAIAVAVTMAALMLVQWLGRVRQRAKALEVDNARLNEQSTHDPLTGLYNRRHCETLMTRLTQAAQAEGRQAKVGLMVLDVDFFKRVNDTHGHAAGDAVLVEVAKRLQSLLRDQDTVVRWGGEEFVLVLPGTLAEGLPTVAERVLAAIANEPILTPEGVPLAVQVSGGCIVWPAIGGQGWEDALQIADLALYQSKAGGRHRVTCLMAVSEQADLERVRRDLAAARQAGDITLQTVIGPAPRALRLVESPAVA